LAAHHADVVFVQYRFLECGDTACTMHPVLLKQVHRIYQLDSVGVPALSDINLEIRDDCFTVISGPSGSGKTTLLNLIGCIDRPDRGEVIVAPARAANVRTTR
jgi:ABC-type lipoprotein export system ATPase subunit